MQPYLEVWLMFTQFTLGLYKPHIIYLGAHKSCFSEMVLLSSQSMCCGLVEREVILHQALLSACLVDVYSIYLSFLQATQHMFWLLKGDVSVRRFF